MSRNRLLFLLLLVAWPLFLALQQGDDFDESEHCHVAWMMGRMHEQPLRDFFQHHQPLLWDLLKTYYIVGGDGPEVLYFGLCWSSVAPSSSRSAPSCWRRLDARPGGSRIPRPVRRRAERRAGAADERGSAPALVIRPETIGLPLFCAGPRLLDPADWRPAVGGSGAWSAGGRSVRRRRLRQPALCGSRRGFRAAAGRPSSLVFA